MGEPGLDCARIAPMDDCVFCKIIADEIPSYRVFEDDRAIAILDLTQPVQAIGHVLVLPREHIEHIYQADESLLGHLMEVARQVAVAVKHAYSADGVLVWQSNEQAAGQVVPHLHIHVFPRFQDDEWELFAGKLPPQASVEALIEARDAIRAHLS